MTLKRQGQTPQNTLCVHALPALPDLLLPMAVAPGPAVVRVCRACRPLQQTVAGCRNAVAQLVTPHVSVTPHACFAAICTHVIM